LTRNFKTARKSSAQAQLIKNHTTSLNWFLIYIYIYIYTYIFC